MACVQIFVRGLAVPQHYICVDAFYRRRLPHWQPDNADIFLTWRLSGSLPRCLTDAGHGPALQGGRQFVAFDRQLDNAVSGPKWLTIPKIADAVAEVVLAGHLEWHLYVLHAWVLMPNHVHMLISPEKPLAEITRTVKSASARRANAIFNRRGQPFWAIESYDHWIRSEAEFSKIVDYIEANPVKAGYAQSPENWRWSSAAIAQ